MVCPGCACGSDARDGRFSQGRHGLPHEGADFLVAAIEKERHTDDARLSVGAHTHGVLIVFQAQGLDLVSHRFRLSARITIEPDTTSAAGQAGVPFVTMCYRLELTP